jgi:serine protease Do
MDRILSRLIRRRSLIALVLVVGAWLPATVPAGAGASPALWAEPSPGVPVIATPWTQVAARARGAAVGIRAKRLLQDTSEAEGYAADGRVLQRESLGSGFLIASDGVVVTANHVIQGATGIRVKLASGVEHPARVIGQDPKTDLAVLKIAASGLPSLPLGDSDLLQVGDPVAAIGNPFGLDGTMTTGIVSGLGRVIGAGAADPFIQTDAAINPGNSGGPLVNLAGAVVGVNTAILSRTGGSIGIGFAIPINVVKTILPILATSGHVTRGWLGVGVTPVTTGIARTLRFSGEHGGLVVEVVPYSPAEAAGIQLGDVIIGYEGHSISAAQDLGPLVVETVIGKEVSLQIWRGGAAIVLTARVVEQADVRREIIADGADDGLFIAVQRLTPALARDLGVPYTVGLVVINVDGTAPSEALLKPKDIILEVNWQPVRTAREVARIVAAQPSGEATLMVISRNTLTMLVPIEASIRVQE